MIRHTSRRLFLSTPSARRATVDCFCLACCYIISIHALREEGDQAIMQGVYNHIISIHALREEGDRLGLRPRHCAQYFYPRPPRGGRHGLGRSPENRISISIHALREEGDQTRRAAISKTAKFLSTPSARRATSHQFLCDFYFTISIHALREEGDSSRWSVHRGMSNFYPRPPRGGRPLSVFAGTYVEDFYPRPPRGGRRCTHQRGSTYRVFLSTPSARRAT